MVGADHGDLALLAGIVVHPLAQPGDARVGTEHPLGREAAEQQDEIIEFRFRQAVRRFA